MQTTWPRCPDVWKTIGEELKYWFIDEEGLCSDLAAQAIRLPFHDCFPSGGCDGSIILTNECTTRLENSPLVPICGILYKMTLDYGVGAADLINFAACKLGLKQTAKHPANQHFVQRWRTKPAHGDRTFPSTLEEKTMQLHLILAKYLLQSWTLRPWYRYSKPGTSVLLTLWLSQALIAAVAISLLFHSIQHLVNWTSPRTTPKCSLALLPLFYLATRTWLWTLRRQMPSSSTLEARRLGIGPTFER